MSLPIKLSPHQVQQALRDAGHNISYGDIVYALSYPDSQEIGIQERLVIQKDFLGKPVEIVVSCAVSAGQPLHRVVTAHQIRRKKDK